MTNDKIMAAHLEEAASRAADITNLGHYAAENEIESKTTAGKLRTLVNDDGEIEHQWYNDKARIQLQAFNEAPTAAEAQNWLQENGLLEEFTVADAAREFWQNDAATLVLKHTPAIKPSGVSMGTMVKLTKFTIRFSPDEFDTMSQNYETYIRLWWD